MYNGEGRIRIKADKERKLLIIADEGIGMNKSELIQNLGTIAQSGTAKFIKQIAEGTADSSLIGQFGVGFYSSYLVAETVEVSSRHMDNGSPQFRWKSNAGGTFSVYEETSETFDTSLFDAHSPGTRVILHMKEDADEYLEDYKIKELLRKYSEFITYPIELWCEKIEYERVVDNELSKPGDSPRMKTITKRKHEWECINTQPPIWRRNNKDVADEDYNQFYKSTFKAYDDPLGFIHFQVEGQIDFSSVLFVPGTVPWELSRNMFDEESKGIRLYVKRVFINDKFTDATPRWLTFIRGVVDSEDLPLNVGREMLQKSRLLALINKRVTIKAIDMLKNIQKQGGEKWKKLWENFGKYIKVGVIEDPDNQERIASLLEFWSTKSGAERVTLDDYITRMKTNQTSIFFVSGESKSAAYNSPALEQLRRLDYEVLFCTEPVDEFCLQALASKNYKSFKVMDATKSDLKLPELNRIQENEDFKEKQIQLEQLCDWLHNLYKQKVMKVVVSSRLVHSPVVLVQGDFGLSPTMQKYIRQQAAASGMTENDMYGSQINQAVMEINPNHAIIDKLRHMVSKDPSSPQAASTALLLYDVACLHGGYATEDPSKFASSIVELMARANEYEDRLHMEPNRIKTYGEEKQDVSEYLNSGGHTEGNMMDQGDVSMNSQIEEIKAEMNDRI